LFFRRGRRHKAILLDEGFELGTWRWFEIPIDRLEPEKTVIYRSRVRPYGDFELRPDEFESFSPERLQQVREEPIGLRAHIRQAKAEGRRPLVAAACPHVLFRGTIDIGGLHIAEE
jgi:hypothetical protein